MIFKVGAFLAFIMLSYLGLRSYKLSVEKMRTNACTEEVIELVRNIQDAYKNSHDYGEFDYKIASKMNVFPRKMKKEGFNEPINSYIGGVDVYYSSLSPEQPKSAFEVSFQGLSSFGCFNLVKLFELIELNLIAVAGFSSPTAAGVLENIYLDTKQEEVKKSNIFIAKGLRYTSDDKIKTACSCKKDICSVVWKFR